MATDVPQIPLVASLPLFLSGRSEGTGLAEVLTVEAGVLHNVRRLWEAEADAGPSVLPIVYRP